MLSLNRFVLLLSIEIAQSKYNMGSGDVVVGVSWERVSLFSSTLCVLIIIYLLDSRMLQITGNKVFDEGLFLDRKRVKITLLLMKLFHSPPSGFVFWKRR